MTYENLLYLVGATIVIVGIYYIYTNHSGGSPTKPGGGSEIASTEAVTQDLQLKIDTDDIYTIDTRDGYVYVTSPTDVVEARGIFKPTIGQAVAAHRKYQEMEQYGDLYIESPKVQSPVKVHPDDVEDFDNIVKFLESVFGPYIYK
jgi:hypothetical protein